MQADGVQTRPAPGLPNVNYQSYEHADLRLMVTEQVDADQVGETGDLYLSAGDAMLAFQREVGDAITDSHVDWQGEASDAARRFMGAVGGWVGQAAQSAKLAGTQTGVHAAALAQAKNSMPEEKPFDIDAANRDLAATTNPLDMIRKFQSYLSDYRESQAAQAEAARVVGSYDSALAGASAMPAFPPPPTLSGGAGHSGAQSTSPNSAQATSPNSAQATSPNSAQGTSPSSAGDTSPGGYDSGAALAPPPAPMSAPQAGGYAGAMPPMGAMPMGGAALGSTSPSSRPGRGSAGEGGWTQPRRAYDDHDDSCYLLDGDGDQVFGSDQRTAPPVIGG